MRKKEELAIRFMEAMFKCDCSAAETILVDPNYNPHTQVILLESHIKDPVAREIMGDKKRGAAQAVKRRFTEACPRATAMLQDLAERTPKPTD